MAANGLASRETTHDLPDPVPEGEEAVDRYRTERGAAAYRSKYERSLFRRWSNRRELAIVDRFLRTLGASERVLDCPCGAGRLVPTLLKHARHVTGVDRSETMIDEARAELHGALTAGRVDLRVAPAEELPFESATFDVTVCHRLIYHVRAPEERARVFAELARVTRRSVLLCFNDSRSLKMRWRALRRRGRVRPAWTPESLDAETRPHGLRVEGPVRRLNGLTSALALVALRVET